MPPRRPSSENFASGWYAKPEKRYFVVLEATHSGEQWEVGMVYVRTEMGNDTPERRHARAQLLFAQVAELL